MSYVSNQYNYATPPSSISGLVGEQRAVTDKKYFTLFDNVLDGSYSPISGDVGLWGSSLSDAEGVLSAPLVVTITEETAIGVFMMDCSIYSYPVGFTVDFYDGTNLLYTIVEANNTTAHYSHELPQTIDVTSYTITITKINRANSVPMLHNLYNPVIISSADTLVVSSSASTKNNIEVAKKFCSDFLRVHTSGAIKHMTNIVSASETLRLVDAGGATPINVHSAMKAPSRRIYGRVQITYTDPMLAYTTEVSSSGAAYNSVDKQLMDGNKVSNGKFFTLYENDLTGNYIVSDEYSQVGWTSTQVSDANGYFSDVVPYLRVDFAERPIVRLPIVFDTSRGCVAEDFVLECFLSDGRVIRHEVVGNTAASVYFDDVARGAVAVKVTVTKVSKPFMPVTVLEIPIVSTIEYVGYQDRSDLISIDLLEELSYTDEVEALGGVSANEITVMLDNSSKQFYFNNPESLVASSLLRNRKIEPWLGVEILPGEIEWHSLGTFWSRIWDVPVESLVATVTGYDTIGLLSNTPFKYHTMQVNKSIGELIEYILTDAKDQLDFIEWDIAAELYDVRIPYAWFEASSHAAALRKISDCYPMHIYCNRQGTICAYPQKLRLDNYYDAWSDSTNVISKKYSSLFTTLPNIVKVEVKRPSVVANYELAMDDLEFDIQTVATRTLNFSTPYISDIVVTVDCDSTVTYNYDVHSWGIEMTFYGAGTVRSIRCVGAALEISNTSTLSRSDENSVRLNGAVERSVVSDFIQTSAHAAHIIDRIFSLSENDKFDVDVEYRGDIALSINDPILLLNGIAPDNRYNIKRHELTWNGSLTGSAHLNT